MEVTYSHCAGLDVHKKLVVACCLYLTESGKLEKETRSFGTTTEELLSLSSWFSHLKITHLAMESTGEYWKPVYNILESSFEVMVVNAQHLTHLDFLEEQIAIFDSQIRQLIEGESLSDDDSTAIDSSLDTSLEANSQTSTSVQPLCWQQAVELLDSIPGVARRTAELLIAEIGCDMSRFKSAAHLAKWAKLCPGNYESAGQRLAGRTGQSNTWLRSALVQAANAAVRCKNSYLNAVYRRLVARRGRKKAIVAVAHRIVIALYHMLTKHEPYRDLGANYLDHSSRDHLLQGLSRQATKLGYQVEFTPIASTLS